MTNVRIVTAIKPTWRELHIQRLRWNRGITETLCEFGLTRYTWKMWFRWIIYVSSVLAVPLSFFLMGYLLTSGNFGVNMWLYLWLGVTAVTASHKLITLVGTRRWSALAAATIVVELPYDTFLHLTFVRALWEIIDGRHKNWRLSQWTFWSTS